MKFILTLDQGTTSSRAILFDKNGAICGMAQQEFPQIFPKSGWVEHDAEEIWQSQVAVMQRVLIENAITIEQIETVGITNQRETTVVWNRHSGKPVYNAIVWQDRRTATRCQELRSAGYAKSISAKTGLVVDAYFSATKVEWILKHVDGARKLADNGDLLFGTIDTWLLWKLTKGKVHATDASNASRTMLCNIDCARWDQDLLDLFHVPASMMPEIRPSSGDFGEIDAKILCKPLPVTGIAGDQQAALFGQACFSTGMAKNTYGTGCFMLMNTGDKRINSTKNLLTTIAWKTGDKIVYALEGSVFIGGAVVQWLRDGLGIINSSSEVEELAASVKDSGDVVFVPAFTGLGAPHWDPYARGMIHGLSRGTTSAHIARAALESIAHQSADLMEAMSTDAAIPLKEMRVDGGASSNDLLMQIQADFLNVMVDRPLVQETTALGAAFLAGLHSGFWKSIEQVADCRSTDVCFKPRQGNHIPQSRAVWKKAVLRSKNWVLEDQK